MRVLDEPQKETAIGVIGELHIILLSVIVNLKAVVSTEQKVSTEPFCTTKKQEIWNDNKDSKNHCDTDCLGGKLGKA